MSDQRESCIFKKYHNMYEEKDQTWIIICPPIEEDQVYERMSPPPTKVINPMPHKM